MSNDETAAFFTRDAERFAPKGLDVSPWNGKTQGGISLAGLVAHLLDRVPVAVPTQTLDYSVSIMSEGG